MKLLVYLRFLRPLRSLALIALYVVVAYAWGQKLLRGDDDTARFIALAVALPLLFGIFISGAAHEPMHRPFALLLPNLRSRQRTAAGYSLLVAAFATTWAVTWAAPTISPIAAFGLACALIALPCFSRYQVLGKGSYVVFFVWFFIGSAAGAKLGSTMNSASWLFLFGGLSISAVCLAHGFSRASLRARANTWFVSYQTSVFAYFFSSGKKAPRETEKPAQPNRLQGRDWTVRSVGAGPWPWMRVAWHENFARSRHGSYLKSQCLPAFGLAFLVLLLPVLSFVSAPPEGAPSFTIAGYFWKTLANLGVADSASDASMWPLMLLNVVICLLLAMTVARPQMAYPISRRRLADVVFRLSLVQLGLAFSLPVLAVFFPCLLGQIMSRHFLPGLGLPALATLDLGLLPLLSLLACVETIGTPAERILAGLPVAVAVIVVAITHTMWSRWILSAPGLALVTVATAITLLLLRWRIRHHYRTCDLLDELGSDTLSVHRFGEQN